jgi:serine protease SohB
LPRIGKEGDVMLGRLWYKLPFTGTPAPKVALIPLHGTIAAEARTQRALNLEAVDKALQKAFTLGGASAVVLSINSPGGAPAQARMIFDRIRSLSDKKKVPVLAYIEDVGASGGYMIALAGEEIFADPFGIVGSIGVIAGGFGFPEAIRRLGVERRVYTAGKNKSQLDPFREEDPEDVRHLQILLDKSHQLFIDMVRARRGGRLNGEDDELFSGQFWLAGDAAERGLIDGTADLRALLKSRYGDEVRIKRIDVDKKTLLSKILSRRSAPTVGAVIDQIEDRVAWWRVGL